MKIDLHVHSFECSRCASSTEKEQIEAAIARGLDGIAFTDHNHQRSQIYLEHLNEKYAPFKIFTGTEINTIDTGEDVLIFGVPELEEMNDYYWEYAELFAYVRERGGFIVLAHPFRYDTHVRTNVSTFVPDALEIRSTNVHPRCYRPIQKLANKLGVHTIATSDSHHRSNIGQHYVIFQNEVYSDAALVRELKAGRYEIF